MQTRRALVEGDANVQFARDGWNLEHLKNLVVHLFNCFNEHNTTTPWMNREASTVQSTGTRYYKLFECIRDDAI